MCLRFVLLLITRVAAWLRLSQRKEAWQTAEILILRQGLRLLVTPDTNLPWHRDIIFAVAGFAQATRKLAQVRRRLFILLPISGQLVVCQQSTSANGENDTVRTPGRIGRSFDLSFLVSIQLVAFELRL